MAAALADAKHMQPIYVQEFISSSASSRLDLPKRIKSATKQRSFQKRHRKAIPAILLPILLSIFMPSVLEGEAHAKTSTFQQVEYKTEDCELKTEQEVDQQIGNACDTKITQLVFGSCIENHLNTNVTSRSHPLLPLLELLPFYCEGSDDTNIMASEGDAERQHQHQGHSIQRQDISIPPAAKRAADKSLAVSISMAAAIAILSASYRRINSANPSVSFRCNAISKNAPCSRSKHQADIFTKPVDDTTFFTLRKLLCGW